MPTRWPVLPRLRVGMASRAIAVAVASEAGGATGEASERMGVVRRPAAMALEVLRKLRRPVFVFSGLMGVLRESWSAQVAILLQRR